MINEGKDSHILGFYQIKQYKNHFCNQYRFFNSYFWHHILYKILLLFVLRGMNGRCQICATRKDYTQFHSERINNWVEYFLLL